MDEGILESLVDPTSTSRASSPPVLSSPVPPITSRQSESSATDPSQDELVLQAANNEAMEEFRAHLGACKTDSSKFQLCEDKINELLQKFTIVESEIVAFDRIMSSECLQYRQKRHGRPKNLAGDYEAEWDRFVGVAETASKSLKDCMTALKSVTEAWGWDKVKHYGWVFHGLRRCKALRAAANKNPDWTVASRKLCWLELRRTQLSRSRSIKFEIDPLELADINHLKDWDHTDPFIIQSDPEKKPLPYQKMTRQELPGGFGFDKFGLLVREKFAINERVEPTSTPGEDAADDADDVALHSPSDQVETDSVPGDDTAYDPVDVAIDLLDQVTETGLKPVNDAVNEKRFSNNLMDTTEDRGPDTVDPDGSIRTSETSVDAISGDSAGDESDGGEDEDDNRLTPEQYPSPDPSIPKQPRRRFDRLRKDDPSYRETRSGASKSRGRKRLKARCCPPEVPPILTSVLTPTSEMDHIYRLRTAEQYSNLHSQLCYKHLRAFAELVFDSKLVTEYPEDGGGAHDATNLGAEGSPRKRPFSRPPDFARESLYKRPRLVDANDASQTGSLPTPEPSAADTPDGDHDSEEAFRKRIISELERNFSERKFVLGSHGERTDRLIFEALRNSRPPQTGAEALICDGDEALEAVERGQVNAPIFTQGQQQFRWNSGARPIHQIFRRMDDSDQRVSVQVSSRKLTEASAEEKTIRDVQERFLGDPGADGETWNLLGLPSPLPSLLPGFLMGENARLLHQAGDVILAGGSTGKSRAARVKWEKWKNVLEWVLLSAGYNTGPHRDAYGFATWITIQEGQEILGWLSNPTDQELQDWMADPYNYTSDKWRHRVLNAGQTVLIPSGVVHYVARSDDSVTVAVGGHVLFWSDAAQWSKVMVEELQHEDTINEDMENAPQYVSAIKKLVKDRQGRGRVNELGGDGAVVKFHANIKTLKLLLRDGL